MEEYSSDRLKELQALPLDRKILITQAKIIDWYNHFNGNVYISFSGGKDSTVLLHIARSLFPDIKAYFVNTGLEYPEIQKFIRQHNNVEVLRPKMQFNEVISNYGYPLISKEIAETIYYARRIKTDEKGKTTLKRREQLIGEKQSVEKERDRWKQSNQRPYGAVDKSKWLPFARELPFAISHYCCYVMKKSPLKMMSNATKSKPILGSMASESRLRKQAWIKHGCNAYDSNTPISQPMSFWTDQDVLQYIKYYNLDICSVYGEIVEADGGGLKCSGCDRTGCVFCGFGLYLDRGETRFQRLSRTHPRQYEYCIGGGQWVDNPVYDPTISMEPDDMGWINWNPKKIWVPSKEGLGMGKVFDMCNELYGKDFHRYQ